MQCNLHVSVQCCHLNLSACTSETAERRIMPLDIWRSEFLLGKITWCTCNCMRRTAVALRAVARTFAALVLAINLSIFFPEEMQSCVRAVT